MTRASSESLVLLSVFPVINFDIEDYSLKKPWQWCYINLHPDNEVRERLKWLQHHAWCWYTEEIRSRKNLIAKRGKRCPNDLISQDEEEKEEEGEEEGGDEEYLPSMMIVCEKKKKRGWSEDGMQSSKVEHEKKPVKYPIHSSFCCYLFLLIPVSDER